MRKWLIPLAAFLLIALIFFPQIASTPIGKSFFIKRFEQKSGLEVEVGSLKFSWFGPQIFRDIKFRRDSGAQGSFEELHILAPFWSFSGPFLLENGQISYGDRKIENIAGQIEGNDFSLTGTLPQGHILLKGQIYSKIDFHIQVDIEKLPSAVIDPRLSGLLGPTLNLIGLVAMDQGKGSIDLKVTSSNLQTEIKGDLSEKGMRLQEPLFAKIQLVPNSFFKRLSTEGPATLRIDPKDFFFPLPYSLTSLKLGKATLDLGKARYKNDQTMAALFTLLKMPSFSDMSQMNIWFAPVSFQINQGILKVGRLDALLADSFHICTWGNIDLIRDKLDMTLGLPASTLKKAFGIKNLPENYVLKIEVRGKVQSPEINKTSFGVKIGALLAAEQIPKKGIFGGLADIFSKSQDSDVPAPNRPFPWEN